MKIVTYKDFNSINEELSFESIIDNVKPIIMKYYEMGKEYLLKYLEKLSPEMKKHIVTNAAIIGLLVGPCQMTPIQVKKIFKVSGIEKTLQTVKTKREKFGKDFLKFLDSISERESSGDPESVNSLGYMGKYQFGKIALKDINVEVDLEKFKKDPKIWPEKKQDAAMLSLLFKNKKYLGKYYTQYNGKKVGGIKITHSGMLAASHLLGASNVKKFLQTGGEHNPADGYGTKLTEYLDKFGGYDLDI
jgi:hypothetical protein